MIWNIDVLFSFASCSSYNGTVLLVAAHDLLGPIQDVIEIGAVDDGDGHAAGHKGDGALLHLGESGDVPLHFGGAVGAFQIFKLKGLSHSHSSKCSFAIPRMVFTWSSARV